MPAQVGSPEVLSAQQQIGGGATPVSPHASSHALSPSRTPSPSPTPTPAPTPSPAPASSPAPAPSPSSSPAHSLSPAHTHPPRHSPGGSIGSQPSQGDKESVEDGRNDSGTAPQESLPSNEVRNHPHLFLDLEFSVYRHRLAVRVSRRSQNRPVLPVKADLHALLQIKIASKEQARMLLVRLHASARRPTPKHTMLHPSESGC